ncbi:hypothetical protein ABD86_00095 [Paenibacillus alvei]|nr:hypothetical protein [Paenibacillus alvei]MBG9742409.1 hypothetical protein [Paenibacillus alvei]
MIRNDMYIPFLAFKNVLQRFRFKKDRRKGLAATVASTLILDFLDRGKYPGWDAANAESVELAKKLGYTFKESYPPPYNQASHLRLLFLYVLSFSTQASAGVVKVICHSYLGFCIRWRK